MLIRTIIAFGALAIGTGSLSASTATVTFTKLTGLTGGNGGTAVYVADLGSIGFNLSSVSILDASFGIGGAAGQFSGFDLDGIKLSRTLAADAPGAQAAAGLPGFDYSPSGTIFIPGAQRIPVDPKLFGTGPTGSTVDDVVATLGSFDAISSTAIPPATGFMSMGDGGQLIFNLTSAINPAGGLYLYIGEVGDNGEVAAGTITVSDQPQRVPEAASSFVLLGLALAGVRSMRRFVR
jgi:hypothetical protein